MTGWLDSEKINQIKSREKKSGRWYQFENVPVTCLLDSYRTVNKLGKPGLKKLSIRSMFGEFFS